ncbi:MAG: ATP-binding protein [Planctomycetaceae bacterium]|nr:ATP-binding protein [Planctomycetaceae bacterium]
MSLLQTIQTGKLQGPPRLLIYGTEGIGKSTFGASAPKPIFVPTEDGLDNIECAKFPLCRSFDDAINCLDTLLKEQHDYRTVVVDSLDWLERLIWDHTCLQHRAEDIEKVGGGYGKGYTIVLTYWRKFIDLLREIRQQRNMIVILLAHAQVRQHVDPETTAFDQFLPKLHKNANALVAEWCDAILMATREYGAAKGEKGGGQRILRCERSATCSAKNRYNLPETLPLNWNALTRAMYGNAVKPNEPKTSDGQ